RALVERRWRERRRLGRLAREAIVSGAGASGVGLDVWLREALVSGAGASGVGLDVWLRGALVGALARAASAWTSGYERHSWARWRERRRLGRLATRGTRGAALARA